MRRAAARLPGRVRGHGTRLAPLPISD